MKEYKPKCYLAQLKPFPKGERNNVEVTKLQEDSIREKICGIGFGNESFDKDFEFNLSDYDLEKLKDSHNRLDNIEKKRIRIISEALNIYSKIKEGDYILTRLYDTSKCYIGKVTRKAYHSKEKLDKIRHGENYSWIIDVEKWKYIGLYMNIPGALRGLMQGKMNTIKQLYDNIHCKIIKNLYEGIEDKIELGENDFFYALDALDLEDLVAKYITKIHPQYRLVPSSCKSNEQTLEFKFVYKGKKITCQVKNNKPININTYNKIANEFEKIYLYSARGYEGEIENQNIIKKISNVELFNVLKNDFENKEEFYEELNKYYNIR